MSDSFFDTNVLVYLASSDSKKADQAERVVVGGGFISVQVLNELANVARRKMQLSWEETRSFLSSVRELLAVLPLTIETHDAGVFLAERYRLSMYDALIVASALESGCQTLWSEDMQHGMLVEQRLKVINPFG